ncbi:MAG TPA: glycosyltransferase family 4 protein [Methylomirabilota bacterium]|nr:glycosyltransferase family 4 protein [Methylomirabilota bacterium]
MKWICCQLGAREHYTVPRALQRAGELEEVITEAWVRPGHPLGVAKASLRQRFHPELKRSRVTAANFSSIAFELRGKLIRKNGWPLVLARNEWFQRQALRRLRNIPNDDQKRTLFAYSYAARELFRHARSRGWRTVLGQIDPGMYEEKLVQKLFNESGGEIGNWKAAPQSYWQDWRQECELADYIVVNSLWSRQGLLAEGVPSKKLRVVPLAFELEKDDEAQRFHRICPECFTAERPLRALFLGQVNLRKGIRPLLDAVRRLADQPIEFWFVGPVQIHVPGDLRDNRRIRWLGPVSRRDTARFYRDADVFLFPTLSDGFGLTQLEAQAWKLPIIASRFCGDVVVDGQNGILLDEVTTNSICSALLDCSRESRKLQQMADRPVNMNRFGLDALAKRFSALETADLFSR